MGTVIWWSSKVLPGSDTLDDELMPKWNNLLHHTSHYQALVRDEPELLAEDEDDKDTVYNKDD